MSVILDLAGDPRPGDETRLQLGIDTAARAPGSSLPLGNLLAATSGGIVYWADLVTIEDISEGGRSGRLTFEELAREGKPNLSWPATLNGDLSWECSSEPD